LPELGKTLVGGIKEFKSASDGEKKERILPLKVRGYYLER